MTELIASRSAYLQEAAHLLAISSPSASAFLGSARDRLVEDSEIEVPARERDALRRETCGACGYLLIPGWSCEVSNANQPRKGLAKGKTTSNCSPASDTNLVYQCRRCHRTTELLLQTQPRRQLNKKSTMPIIQKPGITTSDRPAKEDDTKILKTSNSSSKQRQKARKGGLQAMLDKNKSQSSSQALDLMDFAM
jgi:RNase P subunit RPR2